MLDISNMTLQAAGLISLADLPAVIVRTALIGTASYSDALVITPGMHRQQTTSEINRGEFHITGAMTTGYIFRVENPATVHYLQSIGVTGHLVTVHVYPCNNLSKMNSLLWPFFVAGVRATLLYALCPVLTIIVAVSLVRILVIKRRNKIGWKGQKEPGVQGDLFIFLCHDRWVRLQGAVDDLKAVASDQWLRDIVMNTAISVVVVYMTAIENFAISCATMLVYVSAALAFNASKVGSMLIASLLLSTVALLTMYDLVIRRVGAPKKYERRLMLANELIAEIGSRNDWAIGMGLVLPRSGGAGVVNV
ncbi:hypothetical protein EV421DRAFT_2011090 [Armillaria borealis]|uniref:Uncharacterized protein n=1 Tax=Armillaria borealis TaxID=47425 RepID=A0AA39MJH8_9AGAR|nr:hypothetical protein EV421DRAFT_2011090 [Armillaria borealis]